MMRKNNRSKKSLSASAKKARASKKAQIAAIGTVHDKMRDRARKPEIASIPVGVSPEQFPGKSATLRQHLATEEHHLALRQAYVTHRMNKGCIKYRDLIDLEDRNIIMSVRSLHSMKDIEDAAEQRGYRVVAPPRKDGKKHSLL